MENALYDFYSLVDTNQKTQLVNKNRTLAFSMKLSLCPIAWWMKTTNNVSEKQRDIFLSWRRKLAALKCFINLKLRDYFEYGLIPLRAESKENSSSDS